MQDTQDYVGRPDQLRMQPSARGRGRGGRGRGRTSQKQTSDETTKADSKKRKGKTNAEENEDEEFWTEDMTEEWFKWKYDGCWFKEHEEEAEQIGWDDKGKSWDRYAHLDGKESIHKLKATPANKSSKASKDQQDTNMELEVSKKNEKKLKKETKRNRNNNDDKEQEKTTKKVKADPKEPKEHKEQGCPEEQKDQVKAIVTYLKSLPHMNIQDPKQLTSEDKQELRKGLLPSTSEEVRQGGMYWKRPAFAVHYKGEGRDIAYFFLNGGSDDDFLLRLGAGLKASTMMVTCYNLNQSETQVFMFN